MSLPHVRVSYACIKAKNATIQQLGRLKIIYFYEIIMWRTSKMIDVFITPSFYIKTTFGQHVLNIFARNQDRRYYIIF